MTSREKKVISASRREDMVAHSPEKLASILTGAAGGSFRFLEPARIHTLVIWTRDFRNLIDCKNLRVAATNCGQIYLHLTATGLAGSFLEPGSTKLKDLLPRLDEVISLIGNPRRLCLRYDPLISLSIHGSSISNLDIGLFESVISPFGEKRIDRIVTSIVTVYPKGLKRMERAPGPEPGVGEAFIDDMRVTAARWGMTVDTCCSPPGDRGCIDAALLTELHPEKEPVPETSNPSQRPGCGCCSSWDIGWYRQCPAGCLYCYAR